MFQNAHSPIYRVYVHARYIFSDPVRSKSPEEVLRLPHNY